MDEVKEVVERVKAFAQAVAWQLTGDATINGRTISASDLRALLAHLSRQEAEIAGLREKLNTPELHDFSAGVVLEAAHQRERWSSDHDAGKTAWDWFWLVGYLAQKAAAAAVSGAVEKAQHHTISTAAALANWHAALIGADMSMRPGINPEERGYAP